MRAKAQSDAEIGAQDLRDKLIVTAKAGDVIGLKALLPRLTRATKQELENEDKITGLMWATLGGSADCVQLLLPISNSLAQDKSGMSALMWACYKGHHSCIQKLLPVSDALARDKDGRTALMHAVRLGHTYCAQMVLRASHALAQDDDGLTALMWAAFNGCISSVEMLLPASNVWAQDNRGRTARDIAWEKDGAALLVIDAYMLALSERCALGAAAGSGKPGKASVRRV